MLHIDGMQLGCANDKESMVDNNRSTQGASFVPKARTVYWLTDAVGHIAITSQSPNLYGVH
jgi:hypothetical protein